MHDTPEKSPYSALKVRLEYRVLNQLRRQAFEPAQVSLAVTLLRLVLLNVEDKDLQPATHSAVIQIETETALQLIYPAFVLACAYSSVERVKKLIVPRKQSAGVDG